MPFLVKFRLKTMPCTIVVIFCLMFIQIYAINNFLDCGKRKLPYQPIITHGVACDISRWPWHAAIYHKLNNVSSYACGGTIVDKNTILTAAHCLFVTSQPLPADRVSVHVGRDHLSTTSDTVQVLEALELLTHPEFRKHSLAHDIAIVKLSSSINMTNFVQPACRWTEDEAQHYIVGKQGTIVGFGKTENDPVSEYLQEANLTVMEGLKCLEDARRFVSQVLTSNMFCAREKPGVSACHGDSGGGMFFERNGTWFVRGIVSFIASSLYDGSCTNSKVTVFTDVNKYLSWIMKFTSPNTIHNGIDSDFLLFSARNGMFPIALSSGTDYGWHLPIGRDTAFDCKEGRIYGVEDNGVIFSVDHNGKDRKEFLRSEDYISRLAVDWIARRLYWYNSSKEVIEVASLDFPDKRTVLISGIWSIFDMVVDPHRGKLYWLELASSKSRPIIKWSNLDGTNHETLLGHDLKRFISCITVLMQTGEICFSYLMDPYIFCIDAYTKKNRTIVTTTYFPQKLTATDSLFYLIKHPSMSSGIASVNMEGERQPSIAIPPDVVKYTDFDFTITLVTGKCPNSYNPCAINNGDCSENTICLRNPDAPGGKNCTALSTES